MSQSLSDNAAAETSVEATGSFVSAPLVVGVGASAGGLDAVTGLIKAWRHDPRVVLILVQHSDPSGGSMMPALLVPHTSLVVLEAVEDMPIEPGHLYVAPPGRYLAADGGRLHLSSPPARHGARMPFDHLLQSLSAQYGDRAACVVLSGTGADGTAGLTAIKAGGGVVAVQDPEEAGYDGMPVSAIATGLADFVLPVAGIPAALARERPHARGASESLVRTRTNSADPDQDLSAIIHLLRRDTDSDFSRYKHGTLERRIGRRIALAGLRPHDLAAYLALLEQNHQELEALGRDLLIHVTGFFRDVAVFDLLRSSTIPGIVATHRNNQPLRIWIAGCSSGEETYSLAMLFMEAIEASGRPLKLQVFATDVDSDAIAAARDGTYPPSIEDSVAPERLARFFVREDGGWRVAPDLRAAIVFSIHDVLEDPPFSRLDMVSCRNLLIYLRPEAQVRVLEAFQFALRDGGILLLGSAESASAAAAQFETLAKAERIYRRTRHVAVDRPVPPMRADLIRPGEEPRPRAPPLQAIGGRPAALAELGRRIVLEAYGPASVLVDSSYAVLFSLGPVDNYLRLPTGHATQNLLAMARPGLRAKLLSALQTARETKQKAFATGWIAGDGLSRPFDITVHPITEAGEDLLMACFVEVSEVRRDGASSVDPDATPSLDELRRELDATRAELQCAVRDLEMSGEEHRAINEEALSINEEYQSTNEELVASKEELQSLNEELTAVNSQLQETLERQRTTSDDLQNVLYSTEVATLFLDLEGRIRFFTPAIAALFAIIPGDVGRKLANFVSLASDPDLNADLRSAQTGLDPADCEIEAVDGKWFKRRTRPYRTSDGSVLGVVITYTNVTARKISGHAVEVAKMEAEAANAAKSRFLAAASHDLRQPLQTLSLLQALLAETVTGEKARDLVARQEITLAGITGMLNALLDINEIEAGVVQPHISTFGVGDIMDRLRTEFTFLAKTKGIQLRVMPCVQQVCSDEHLLAQILRNLVSNAIKYTAHGRVLVGCRRRGETLGVEVWDTGIGMDDASIPQIFDEYFQVGNAERARSRGLGLGLSIVKRLSDLLGHPVRVRSRPGRGSLFRVEVPLLLAGKPVPLIASTSPGAGDGCKLTILVVDDDPDVCEMLANLLRNQGHGVTTAADGAAAIEGLSERAPDLMVADYNLPNGLNGLELAQRVRTTFHAPIPVLILTGDISSATMRAVKQGGCMILNKPTTFAALRGAIEALLAPVTRTGRPVVSVIDDDDEVRGAIMNVIEADGRSVSGFPSAEAFLQQSRDHDGDCLLVDAKLPGMSGIDLLEQLRTDGRLLPVIVITGQSDVPMAIRAMKAGASDFIEKPVGRPALLASIAHALEGSRDTAQLAAKHAAAAAHIAALTPRQREIMILVLAGHPSKNIAADLKISQRTVENHRAEIMHRTGCASLPALARLAVAANSVARTAGSHAIA